MGKKIDLNKPQNNNNIGKSHHFSRFRSQTNPSGTATEETSQTPKNQLEKKAANIAMKAAGVPKEAANFITNNEEVYELAKKGAFTIKTPIFMKTIIPIVLFIMPIIGLMLFVVLFSDDQTNGYGAFAYGVTCPTVTVVDTGCDAKAQNCTHQYDGEVELEEYVAGVLAAEVDGANNLEFYKVAAISARTYFLSNTDSSCTIKGNATRQAYEDVDDSVDVKLIKQAVEETKSMVLVKNNDLAPTYYTSACVVNADADYYYVRYGTLSIGGVQFQKIPKEWDRNLSQAYHGSLAYWYSMVDQGNTNYEKKSCPLNHDYGMSQIGGLYLAVSENYNYEQIINYYYGNETEIMVNELQHDGTNGFINPTRIIKCVSAFGMRMHPIYHEMRMHNGVDLSGMNTGEPIYAVQSGTVTHVTKNLNIGSSGYGNYVIIQHADGISTLYAHMAYGTVPDSIYVGAEVSQGEQIGGVGTTGASTGDHLHYEVMKNGSRVNPADYIDWTNGQDMASCSK